MQKSRMSWGKGVIRGLVLSPDQKYLAVICAAGVDIYEARTLELRTTFETSDFPVSACTFSADSRCLIAGGQHIFIWDIYDEQLIRMLPDVGHGLTELHTSGQFLVANIAGTVHIWNLERGQHTIAEKSTSDVSQLAVKDNTIIALGVRLQLYDIRTGYLIRELRINNHKIVHMAIRGHEIALLDWDNHLTIWNLQTHKNILTHKGMQGEFLTVWHDRFVVIDTHKGLRGIDAESKDVIFRYESRFRRAQGVILSEDRLYCATIDGSLQMFADTPEPQETSLYTSDFHIVAFSPDDRFVAAGGAETIYVWDTRTGNIHCKHHAHNNIVQFWFHSERMLAVDVHHNVILVNLDTGETANFFQHRFSRQILAMPPYVLYRDNGHLHVWDGYKNVKTIPLSGEQPMLSYDSATKRLAIGFKSRGILVWDFESGDYVFAGDFAGRDNHRFSTIKALGIRGNTLASVKHRSLYVWSIDKQWLRYTVHLNSLEIISVVLSHDEQFIFIQQNDGHVHIYRADDGLLMHVIKSPQYGVKSMALSSDGRTLATVGSDGTIAFWDV